MWSAKRLKDLQEHRLRTLLDHAYKNVPYYRRMFRQRNLKPQHIQSVDDLNKLPIVTKNDIRQHFDEFIARNSQNYRPIAAATGGSTGEPLRFFIDVRSAAAEAALWRGWGYAGYKLGDKMAVLAGLSLVPAKDSLLKAAGRRVIKRTVRYPAMNLRKEILDVYSKGIIEFKPKFIRGYPSSIHFFADFLKDEEIERIRLSAVFTTAEMLLPFQRKLMEKIFQCDVFDGYGAFDGGTGAFECEEHRGYHIALEKVVMEFADDDGNPVAEGENGRIIATDLFNYSMPFVRYNTGDMGVYSNEACPCGRTLPLMKKIMGRTTDILRFKTGAVLSGPSLTLIFKDFDIKQYQVVQTSDDSMVLKIIKGKNFNERDAENIYEVLKDAAGNEVEVKFEFTDYIQPTKSGKWKIVIREVE
jgi:phenylacetate-CoA ligase